MDIVLTRGIDYYVDILDQQNNVNSGQFDSRFDGHLMTVDFNNTS